jgi:hypothetical protein
MDVILGLTHLTMTRAYEGVRNIMAWKRILLRVASMVICKHKRRSAIRQRQMRKS